MTKHADDVISPRGRIDLATVFPGVAPDQAEEWVEQYLQQGYTQAGSTADAAAMKWAEYRAFDGLHLRLSARQASVTNDEGSGAYTQSQIDAWRELADAALAEYEDLVGEAAGEEPGEYEAITSYR